MCHFNNACPFFKRPYVAKILLVFLTKFNFKTEGYFLCTAMSGLSEAAGKSRLTQRISWILLGNILFDLFSEEMKIES